MAYKYRNPRYNRIFIATHEPPSRALGLGLGLVFGGFWFRVGSFRRESWEKRPKPDTVNPTARTSGLTGSFNANTG